MNPSPAPRPGDQLAGYRLHEAVYQSRASCVFRAASATGENVALKVASAEVDRRAVLRLYQQAHRTRLLKHPVLLSVNEAAVADGFHYIAMPWLPGGSLAGRLAAYGRLSASVAVNLVAAVARGIDVLNAAGIIHGAIRPEHILFSEYELPILSGLGHSSEGVARDLLLRDDDATWVAPETLRTTTHKADPRTDVFGLARLLATMLVGSESLQGGSVTTPEQLNADSIDCPESLGRVIAQNLSSDPRLRVSSAYKFARSINLALRGRPGVSWIPLADSSVNAANDPWFVLMPSRKGDCHRMCRGSRQEVIRLLLRGRLTGDEVASPSLGQPFLQLTQIPEFATAAGASGVKSS